MNNNQLLGLMRLTSREHKEEIEAGLDRGFTDLYTLLEAAQKTVDKLELFVDNVLYGGSLGKSDAVNRVSNERTML
jgi:hypothetical protein